MTLVRVAHRVVLVVAATAALVTATHASDSDVVQQLDTLWQSHATGAAFDDALDQARAVMGTDANNFDVAWRIARAIRWQALKATDAGDKKNFANHGMRWAQRAIELRSDRVEGHFYYMMCVGEYGSTLSIPRALYEGIGGKFEREGLKAYQLDPNFEDGEVLTALGRFYFVLPWPKRDLVKSRRFLEEGARNHSQILMNFVYLAELEYEVGNLAAARAALERVLQADPPSAREETQVEARVLARDRLATWFVTPTP